MTRKTTHQAIADAKVGAVSQAKRRNYYVDADIHAALTIAGSGNASAGIRRLVAMARHNERETI
jgi:hypothetical protein